MASIFSRIIGVHLAGNTGAGSIQGSIEGIVLRFAVGFAAGAWCFSPHLRKLVHDLIRLF